MELTESEKKMVRGGSYKEQVVLVVRRWIFCVAPSGICALHSFWPKISTVFLYSVCYIFLLIGSGLVGAELKVFC